MAKLVQVTEESDGSRTHPTPISKLYGVSKIHHVSVAPGSKANVQLAGKIRNRVTLVSESQSVVLAGMNGVGDKNAIALTVNRIEGELPENATARVRVIDLDDIIEVQADPSDNTDSIVVVEQENSQSPLVLYVEETMAVILAGANSSAESNPVPGGAGALATANVLATSFDVTFTKATDPIYAQTELIYALYTSESDNVSTVEDAEANGTLQEEDTDVATLAATGLTTATAYYFNVIVRNPSGWKAAYVSDTDTTA